jgi:hypothetical protein
MTMPARALRVAMPATLLAQRERERLLPVDEALAPLLPWGGLRRGSTVAVRGSTAVLVKLLAAATTTGSWAAVVGMPGLGVLAAAELGVAIERLALVARPGADAGGVIAALLDGMDLVVLDGSVSITPALARRLSARARSRGAVLLVREGAWPGPDVELRCDEVRWSGLGDGHGYLRSRRLVVATRGRGAAARPMRAEVELGVAG